MNKENSTNNELSNTEDPKIYRICGSVCLLLCVILALMDHPASSGLLMIMGFALLLLFPSTPFDIVAIGLTGIKATKLLKKAEIKMDELKRLVLVVAPDQIKIIKTEYLTGNPIFNPKAEEKFRDTIQLLNDFKVDANEINHHQQEWNTHIKQRYITLIINYMKMNDNSDEIKGLLSQSNNPASPEEMEALFKRREVDKNTDIIEWLNYYRHYCEYTQHKSVNFMNKLNLQYMSYHYAGHYI